MHLLLLLLWHVVRRLRKTLAAQQASSIPAATVTSQQRSRDQRLHCHNSLGEVDAGSKCRDTTETAVFVFSINVAYNADYIQHVIQYCND